MSHPAMHGTNQHENARDLSPYLVHLTRTEEDLISIVKEGQINGSGPYGPWIPRDTNRVLPEVKKRHRSVCLTEIPLDEIGRIAEGRRPRPWGLIFRKETLRAKYGAQPLWYLKDPSPELEAIRTAMDAAANDPAAPIWRLTPFIADVRSIESGRPNDWQWEREWRVRGNLAFDLDDVAYILHAEAGRKEFADEVSVGVPYLSPDDHTVVWAGGISEAWDRELNAMLARFNEQFVSVEDAGFLRDSETKEWAAFVPVLDEYDAIEEAFGPLSAELNDAFLEMLRNSEGWCRTYDLRRSYE
ncbi:hypothetical protein [Curtobacterium flaccumfaciens]|jgi:hypothetical protein|uniref:hypothetical protein n=1 Tax=Curtobacterium flaccumfaciens TaxID=2035 RepID=UPI003996602E